MSKVRKTERYYGSRKPDTLSQNPDVVNSQILVSYIIPGLLARADLLMVIRRRLTTMRGPTTFTTANKSSPNQDTGIK